MTPPKTHAKPGRPIRDRTQVLALGGPCGDKSPERARQTKEQAMRRYEIRGAKSMEGLKIDAPIPAPGAGQVVVRGHAERRFRPRATAPHSPRSGGRRPS